MMKIIKQLCVACTVTVMSAMTLSPAAAALDGGRLTTSIKAPSIVNNLQNKRHRYVQSSISASEAKAIARQHVRNAEVVDIKRKGARYRVRMIRKDGRVVDVFIDAATGRVL
ncbi:MAG: PepSY domain-containing protein [Maricaulaceae bacterium]